MLGGGGSLWLDLLDGQARATVSGQMIVVFAAVLNHHKQRVANVAACVAAAAAAKSLRASWL